MSTVLQLLLRPVDADDDDNDDDDDDDDVKPYTAKI